MWFQPEREDLGCAAPLLSHDTHSENYSHSSCLENHAVQSENREGIVRCITDEFARIIIIQKMLNETLFPSQKSETNLNGEKNRDRFTLIIMQNY